MSNLSEEEQKAIEWVNKNKDIFPFNALLNYIFKLEKENNSLKQENAFLKEIYSNSDEFQYIERYINENFRRTL